VKDSNSLRTKTKREEGFKNDKWKELQISSSLHKDENENENDYSLNTSDMDSS
jgi:hypothetical protein